jgi:ubiquinone/menaquinone biosynthesis C-methylase UbiE
MEKESSPGTYVLNPESQIEMGRLIKQSRMITRGMGGPLSGIPDPSRLKNILDLCCGPGGWVLDVASALPDTLIEGVDISHMMVDYANTQARTQQLSNASFRVMNIAEPLDVPDASFDLVNARLLVGVLKQDMWASFLRECNRILRPGGLLRLTETLDTGYTSSASVNQIGALIMQALWKAGYGFSPDGRSFGLSHILPSLLREQGYQQIQLFAYALEGSAKMESWADGYHDIETLSLQMKPLLIKLGLITDEAFDQLYKRALADMQSDEFRGMGYFLTVLGQKPTES